MKVLAINGSPHDNGGTFQAIKIVEKELMQKKIQTEIFQLGTAPIQGCIGCGHCKKSGTGLCVFSDSVNTCIDKLKTCDGLIIGSPVYFSGIAGSLKAFLDRLFYAGSSTVRYKPAAALVSVRRAGGVATFDQLNHYLTISEALVVPSMYWSVLHGTTEEAVKQDAEGIEFLQKLGKNLAWLLEMKEQTKASCPPPEAIAKKTRTNFIR